jgi:hypothetical protein
MKLNPGTMDKTAGGCCSLLPPLLARPRLARHEHAEEREVCCIDSVPTETWPSGASCFGSGAGHLGDVGLVTFNKDKMPVWIVTTSQVIRISLFMSQDPSPRVT